MSGSPPLPGPPPRRRRRPLLAQPPPPDPVTIRPLPATAIVVGDVIWLWRMPSSPLQPSYRTVAHVTSHHAEPGVPESLIVVLYLLDRQWQHPIPHMLNPDRAVLTYRPSGWGP